MNEVVFVFFNLPFVQMIGVLRK